MHQQSDKNDIKQSLDPIQGSLSSYNVNALMAQTRKLASDYRQQTGQALPVTEELARFDAINLFGLIKLGTEEGIDATDGVPDGSSAEDPIAESSAAEGPIDEGSVAEGITNKLASSHHQSQNQPHHKPHKPDYYLIKGRVIFKGGKARQKLGKLSLSAGWTVLLMVIYDPDYMPVQIFSVKREIIEKTLSQLPQDKRGSMTIAKYKAIGDLVWDNSAQDLTT